MRATEYLSSAEHRDLVGLLGLPSPLDDPERFALATFQQDPRYTLADGEEPVVRWRLEGLPPTDVSAKEQLLVEQLSGILGMHDGSKPCFGSFTAMVSLGAARWAPVHRLEHILKAIKSGHAITDWIGTVGSARPLDDKERKTVKGYAPYAKIESDLNDFAWNYLTRKYEDICRDAHFLKLGETRARNSDVMRFVMEVLRDDNLLHEGAVVAFSTNRIYEAFTAAEAAIVATDYPGTEIVVVSCAADQKTKDARNHNTYKSELMKADRAFVEAILLGLDPELPAA